MQIENSLDWQKVGTELQSQISQMGFNPDLNKMFVNIGLMVTELSKLEVEARRSRSTRVTNEKVTEINKAIDHLEKLLLMAMLMR